MAGPGYGASLPHVASGRARSACAGCWDNAVTETLFGSLKVERLHGMRFDTRRHAKDEVMDWIAFYNHRRIHSTLGYTSPTAFEQKWLTQQISLAA